MIEGLEVGAVDGLNVGAEKVGDVVGADIVGKDEGLDDGISEGNIVGLDKVGESVGTRVGLKVGT